MEIGQPVGKQPLAHIATNTEALNRAALILNTIRKLEFDRKYFTVSMTPGVGMTVTVKNPSATPGSYPWNGTVEKYTFGLERVSDYQIKVTNCKLRRFGDQTYTCNDTTVNFSGDGDGQQIIWKWSPSSGLKLETFAVTGPIADDVEYVRGVLSVWSVVNGRADLTDYVQCGIINLPVFTVAAAV